MPLYRMEIYKEVFRAFDVASPDIPSSGTPSSIFLLSPKVLPPFIILATWASVSPFPHYDSHNSRIYDFRHCVQLVPHCTAMTPIIEPHPTSPATTQFPVRGRRHSLTLHTVELQRPHPHSRHLRLLMWFSASPESASPLVRIPCGLAQLLS